jgi:hypothetical protein
VRLRASSYDTLRRSEHPIHALTVFVQGRVSAGTGEAYPGVSQDGSKVNAGRRHAHPIVGSRLMRGGWRPVAVLAVVVCGLLLPLTAVPAPTRSAPSQRPPAGSRIAVENQVPGTDEWTDLGRYDINQLAAFAGRTSITGGESIGIHVKGTGTSLSAVLYRLGYYQDHGARRIASYQDIPLSPQPPCDHDQTTGLVACRWAAAFSISTAPEWVSGVYLLRIDSDNGYRFFVHFVVRNDGDGAAIAVSIEFKTNQAYNDYGGESLYVSRTEEGRNRAYRVSFDRPYATGAGTGTFFTHDVDMVRWLEASGYDLTYIADVDRAADPSILRGHRVFIDVGHDEYWTWSERDSIEAALSAGVNMVFASGDESTWHVRLDPSPLGPNRIITSYKDAKLDPLPRSPDVTVDFAGPLLNRPIDSLTGISYQSWFDESKYGGAWVASAPADRWYFECTGLQPGDRINNIVGEEWDAIAPDRPRPNDLEVVASGWIYGADGIGHPHNSIIYRAPSGTLVFSAGSIQWPWGLIDHASRSGSIPVPRFQKGYLSNDADRRVEQLMANILDRFAGYWDGSPRFCDPSEQTVYLIATRQPAAARPDAPSKPVVATQAPTAPSIGHPDPIPSPAAARTSAIPESPSGSARAAAPSTGTTDRGSGADRARSGWTAAVAAADVAFIALGVVRQLRRRRARRALRGAPSFEQRSGM